MWFTMLVCLPSFPQILQIFALRCWFLSVKKFSLDVIIDLIVGQFGTGQFSTGQFGTKIIKTDNLAHGQFGNRTIWHRTIYHQDNLALNI